MLELIIVIGVAAIFVFALLAASKDTTGGEMAEYFSPLKIACSAELGNYLTDENGRTLYCFDKVQRKTPDSADKSIFIDSCAGIWLIFYRAGINAPLPLRSADFSTVEKVDGRKQTTYKGSPLYYYANDIDAGDIKGEGINNLWFTVKIK